MHMTWMAAAAVLLLSACAGMPAEKTHAPAPAVIEIPVHVYVPIDPAMTKRCDWPRKAKPSKALDVGNQRKACLTRYEIQLDAIEKVQGKPVPDAAAKAGDPRQ